MKNILTICGSIRANSANLQIINEVITLAGADWNFELYDISKLPHFNPDLDKDGICPASVIEFRKKIEKADGVFICTPEYVFSLPGVLKNALEWTVSTVVFSDKPATLITASSFGQKSHESLLLIMQTLGVKLNDKTAVLIGGVKSKLNAEAKISDEATLKDMQAMIGALEELIQTNLSIMY